MKGFLAKVLYAILFVVIVPVMLILWAKFTSPIIKLPVPGNLLTGFVLLLAGSATMLSGILTLWFIGKGLPMNAFPPGNFVKRGIYAFIRHPIYSGFVVICFGLSIITGSSSGFWLVTPLFTLMIIAFVAGYENERTLALFGPQDYRTFISLPLQLKDAPLIYERLCAYFLISLPCLVLYGSFRLFGVPNDAIPINLPFEKGWPVWEFSAIFCFLLFPILLLIPLVAKSKEQLRQFILDIWSGAVLTGVFFLAFPFTVNRRIFKPGSYPGQLILSGYSPEGESAGITFLYVILTYIAAKSLAAINTRYKRTWYILATIISVSGITTGRYSLVALIGGFCTFLIIFYRIKIWNLIREVSERLADSWREWRLGPVRIINYGFYGGASGFAGMLIAGSFLGHQNAIIAFVLSLFMIAGAGLWAQLIEGSSKLLRPYGYYGGLAGLGVTGVLVSLIFSLDVFTIFGSFAMAGPWIQCLGRLRCIVQGCCHGKPSDKKNGLRFSHPNSRVNRISGFSGIYLYPTQLYSIGTNIIAGLLLIRLFRLGMPAAFICGIYLILNGTGRFVEESFRGEVQTPYWGGMRIYQWIAIINILFGVTFTMIPGTSALILQPNIDSFYLALAMGLIVTIASGVDFPESNRRFARLTS